MDIFTLENVSFTYPSSCVPAVNTVSFSLKKGAFAVICGATGSGKSTLLRLLKRELSPLGERTGRILFGGTPLEELSAEESAFSIGYVAQRPEEQIVTDKVWHELAFGLENMGLPREAIARRVAEITSFFGIEDWYDRSTSELSGGQKQLLNLASVMAMNPSVLILDEPTAQLDPIAALEFTAALRRLHRELALTVIVAEHRLEELVAECDALLTMANGQITACDAPRRVLNSMNAQDELLWSMPCASVLYHRLGAEGDCPLNVQEGRDMLEQYASQARLLPLPETTVNTTDTVLHLRDVCARYTRTGDDVLRGVSLDVQKGETMCILGANAAGKSTLLSVVSGILPAYSGKLEVFGKKLKAYPNRSLYCECVSMLPQDVQTLFSRNTVLEELSDAQDGQARLPFDFTPLYDQHPYDLSGGQQQLVALAKVLATKPKLLLLDEPTKCLDALAKHRLASMLASLKQEGVTLVIVTHDVEWAATVADRCAMLFRGEIVSVGTPREFFSNNYFYTTAVSRMMRDVDKHAVTLDDALAVLGGGDDA